MQNPEHNTAEVHLNSLEPAARTCGFPLTREQEGLWVEWKLSPLGSSYNTCIQMRLEGELDDVRFCKAIADVVDHFDLLHCAVDESGRAPVFLPEKQAFQLQVLDLSAGLLPEDTARRNRAMAEMTRLRDASIDLTRFPLIRAALIRTDPATRYFIGVVPHIISDGIGAVAILEAISVAYNQGCNGLATVFGADHNDWNEYLTLRASQPDTHQTNAYAHWQQVLAGANHLVPLCETDDKARGGLANTRGVRYFFSFGVDVLTRLNRLARSRKTSLFAIFSALYATLLYRRTGETDLVIVYPVNVRPPGFRRAFGLFVNLLPLRVDLSGNPTFADLVEQIGKRRRADKPHQHLAGLDIVRARREQVPGFDGRLSNVSMAQTMSRFQGLDIPGVRCEALDNDAIYVRDDLSLMYEVSEERVGLWLEYRAAAFDEPAIAAMAQQLLRIVAAVDHDPSACIGSIPLLDAAAVRAVLGLGEGPRGSVAPIAYGTLFELSACRHADEPALVHAGQSIDYRTLERCSRNLATRLLQRPGPVAIVLERSPAQLVTLLAALRAGIPYVPLTLTQGTTRLQRILDTISPSWLVCEPDLLECLPQAWRSLHWAPPADIVTLADTGDLPVQLPVVPETAPAYIMFTSGSTGIPKGVQVSHAALSCRLQWLLQAFPLGPGESVLQNTHYAFDVSVAEILWPLAAGARLVQSDPAEFRDPRYLRTLIRQERIGTVLMVPSALRALLSFAGSRRDDFSTLKRILSAGEPLPLDLAREILRATPARLFNVYGPTEATIYATCREILRDDDQVTIGSPISDTAVAVVNDQLCLQPVGVEGELCLSGPGLADGYYGQAELTAKAFAHGIIDGRRWYRTGDRARLLQTGEIKYLGRRDGQIKLRGYRIELGEIESALHAQPGVTDVAVMLRDRGPKGLTPELIAWVSAREVNAATGPAVAHPLASSRWRGTLASQLPDYMLPHRLNWLDTVPRLPSGKLDIDQLPLSPVNLDCADDDAPTTVQERTMAATVAQVFRVPAESVGRYSNFFELGGDSLLLIALASRLEQAGIYLEVADLFEHPTMAEALPLARSTPRSLTDQSPVQGRFPLLPRQHKFFADNFAHPEYWNRSFVVTFSRHADAAALQASLEAVARHHDGLRATFPGSDAGQCMLVRGPDEVVPTLEICDLTGIEPADRHCFLIERLNALNADLDLETPLLLRAALFEYEDRSTLGFVLHHLLIDMRSCQILLEDLLGAYLNQLAHRPQRLPPKTTSVAEYSERLARLADSRWRIEEVDFWSAQLDHVGHLLPVDHQPSAAGYQARDGMQRTLEIALDTFRTQRLTRELCPAAGLGVQEALLAGFARAFRDWSRSPWLVVNTCGVGRDRWLDGMDLSRTVGELNTVFPLAIDLHCEDILATVHAAYVALPHGGLHYGILRYIAGHAVLNRTEPEIFFNYVSRVDTAVEEALGVSVDMAPAGVRSSHPDNRNPYALYLEAFVRNGELVLHLGYDSARFEATTMQRLLDAWHDEISGLSDASCFEFDCGNQTNVE